MRVAFQANRAVFQTDEYAMVCAVSGEGKHLVLQRHAQDSDDDWGVHLEYCDQAYSGYEAISECRLKQTALAIDLSGQLGALADVHGFDVGLSIDSDSFRMLREGLRRVFRGKPGLLEPPE